MTISHVYDPLGFPSDALFRVSSECVERLKRVFGCLLTGSNDCCWGWGTLASLDAAWSHIDTWRHTAIIWLMENTTKHRAQLSWCLNLSFGVHWSDSLGVLSFTWLNFIFRPRKRVHLILVRCSNSWVNLPQLPITLVTDNGFVDNVKVKNL